MADVLDLTEDPLQSTGAVWVNQGRDKPPPPDYARAGANLSPLLRQCLHNRGVTAAGLDRYLAPDSRYGADPSLLTGVDVAVIRLLRARRDKELVAVYGDGDVDGISATAVLTEALTGVGVRVMPYIPDRQLEQSGLSTDSLREIADRGAHVVITVDCGISAANEIDDVRNSGLDVIITDHHAAPPCLPRALAIINPMQDGCRYPFKSLAGVGVAFKLALGMFRAVGADFDLARELLDLVAIGTIADMVPLVEENRSLVWHGLRAINRTTRPGLQALLEMAGLRSGDLSALDVASRICPRLNGAGRLGNESLAYVLLSTKSLAEARECAELSCARVAERQDVTKRALEDCMRSMREHPPAASDPLVVLNLEPWAAAVSGFVAGKIALESGKSTMVLRYEGDTARGSLRGTPNVRLLDALSAHRDLLSRFGGHQQAAGFTASACNIAALTKSLRAFLSQGGSSDGIGPRIHIDAEIQLQQINWQIYDQLQSLEPCGIGNPKPVFLCRGLRVVDSGVVGNDNLRVVIQKGGRRLTGLAYRRGDLAGAVGGASEIDLVFSIGVNSGQDSRSLQLQILDIGFDRSR
jgi:single-stranded-DNA-specific exonuclease